MVQQWLQTILNLGVATVATILVTLATQLHANSGFTGVGLIALMTFSGILGYFISSWTQLETSLGAVSRLLSFSEMVKGEDLGGETEKPDEEWPTKGGIEIDNVSATYGYAEEFSLELSLFSLSNIFLLALMRTMVPPIMHYETSHSPSVRARR
jgi:ATP-binding cassette subfamily C (CFTR/MRP) protein 1